MQELVDQDAKTVEFRRDLGLMHYRLGKLDLKVKDETAARDHLNKCREIRESLAAGDPTNIRRQIELMKVLPLCGDHERATAIAESLARGTSPDNELLVDIVICYAECAASVSADPERKMRYVTKALDALKIALKQGYRGDLDMRVLDPIRDHPDFVALQKTLKQAKAAPKQNPPPADKP